MIDLKRISSGKQERKPRVLIYAADGIGKTRFAAGAPDPFIIDVNRGSLAYDVKRIIPQTWSETIEWIGAVEAGTVKCESLVIDSISDLEHLGNKEFFPNTTIDKWDGGYGRGEGYALTRWRELIEALERVWQMGKTIILIGHMQVKKFDDPTGPGFERYQIAAREKIAGALRQWVDFVLFAQEHKDQQKVAGGDYKVITNGTRWIHTQRSPAFDAKSRGTTMFPEKILLSWDAFAEARSADKERDAQMRKEIEAMLVEIGDKKLDDVVKEYLRTNPGMVVEARNRVGARLEEMRAAGTKPAAAPAQPSV